MQLTQGKIEQLLNFRLEQLEPPTPVFEINIASCLDERKLWIYHYTQDDLQKEIDDSYKKKYMTYG